MLTSIIESVTSTLSLQTALVCIVVSLALGLVIAAVYWVQGGYSGSYLATLLLLPVLVEVVIMLVNGNLGTGVAVMGAFSLVRFRSLPGNAKEIIGIFFAMVTGLAMGMGYITYAILITVIVSLVMLLLWKCGAMKTEEAQRMLKITIPESLDYNDVFTDLFEQYLRKWELMQVKTANMGSMYELQYLISFKEAGTEKHLMDELRCRNGNLTIVCGRKLKDGVEGL